ncbi:hypothetical protein LAZ67_3002871 [Cordylochernes scorpioides]|uniref:Uncharacterized protein n=1 Tax=Cordylochernes scorpioides TaxID=51811 RepID=A0ABY6KBG1_9ARAC|nr:hypothetical protein LAZ67_3002871 [Cordylochernes scorpioides]
MSPKERDIIKDQIDEMLKEGTIRPYSSPWSFPVILATKRAATTSLMSGHLLVETVLPRHLATRYATIDCSVMKLGQWVIVELAVSGLTSHWSSWQQARTGAKLRHTLGQCDGLGNRERQPATHARASGHSGDSRASQPYLRGGHRNGPPPSGKYDALKARLLQRLGQSKQTKILQVLDGRPMGDQKPSTVLAGMQHQAGRNFSDTVLNMLWTRRLPQDIKTTLAASSETSLSKLAEMTDNTHEATLPAISAVDQPSRGHSAQAQQQLTTQFQDLHTQIEALKSSIDTPHNRHLNARYPTHNKKRNAGTCWYHMKFGEQARKCLQSCNFKGQGNEYARRQPWHRQLFAVSGSIIHIYRKRRLELDLGLGRLFRWPFIIVDVGVSIFGADFLRHYGLTVDLRNQRLNATVSSLHSIGQDEIRSCTV